jgi:hypothetical protein
LKSWRAGVRLRVALRRAFCLPTLFHVQTARSAGSRCEWRQEMGAMVCVFLVFAEKGGQIKVRIPD